MSGRQVYVHSAHTTTQFWNFFTPLWLNCISTKLHILNSVLGDKENLDIWKLCLLAIDLVDTIQCIILTTDDHHDRALQQSWMTQSLVGNYYSNNI